MTSPAERKTSVDEELIQHLRKALECGALDYNSPPTPIYGGQDTSIFSFQLTGAPDAFKGPLILRVFPSGSHPRRALFESKVQNAAAETSYPAPRVRHVCTDAGVLGAAFIVMDLMPGEPMLTMPAGRISEMLADAHVQLHRIDPASLVEELISAGLDKGAFSWPGQFRWFLRSMEDEGLRWTEEGMGWLEKNEPTVPGRLSICHGDFHPLNVLVENECVSGVLDWSGFLVADPVYDVATTKVVCEIAAPVVVTGFDLPRLTREYLDLYRREIPFEEGRLHYYEAYRVLRALLEGARGHRIWTRDEVMRTLITRFKEITGIEVEPPMGRRTLLESK